MQISDPQNVILPWVPLAGVAVSLLGVIIALINLSSQIRRSKFSQSVDLLLKFEDRFFNSAQMKGARRAAANSLLNGGDSSIEDVLDFFETVGMLVRRHALDNEMVWNTFFYWLHCYWSAANDYISKERQEDPTMWEEFSYLHKCMVNVEKRKTRCSDADLLHSKESLNEFLNEESKL